MMYNIANKALEVSVIKLYTICTHCVSATVTMSIYNKNNGTGDTLIYCRLTEKKLIGR